MFMKCSVHVYSLNLLYVTCPLLLKMPLLSLHSLQKVGYLVRSAGGAVREVLSEWAEPVILVTIPET